MTITSQVNKNTYTCNGSTTVFPYTFKIFEDGDIEVVLYTIADGTETVLTLTTDYTVSDAGEDAGGNVTTVSTYSAAYKLILRRDLDLTQPTDYIENDPFPAETHEATLDRLTMLIQQQQEVINRVVLQDGVYSSVLTLPIPVAGGILGWDSTGTYIINNPAYAALSTIDIASTPGYIGAASSDGILRTNTTINYSDGGDFVTLGVNYLDEDDMSTDSNILGATQQSIKAYVDAQILTTDTLQEVFDIGNTIVVADTENKSLSMTQNDTTNNPAALIIANTGTGNDITLPSGASINHGVATFTSIVGTLSTAAQANITSLGTLTTLTVDTINLNDNTISSTADATLVIGAKAGQVVDIETCTFDGGIVTIPTSLDIGTSIAITGVLDEDNMASNSAVKLCTQQSIKKYVDDQILTTDTLQEVFDVGQTITVADTDNQSLTLTQNDTTNNPAMLIIVNTGTGNDITAPNASLKNGTFTGTSFTDGTITITGGNLTGATGVTATTLTGTLATAAQTNVTSLGTLTTLTVDDITINGNTISSAGASSLAINPFAGQNLLIDGHWGFDGASLTATTDLDTAITAYAGKNITIENVTFDGGVVGGVSTLTASGAIQSSDLTDGTTTLNVTELGVSAINFVIDGGGSAITTGIKGDVEIPFACTINRVTLLSDQSATITVDIWKDTYANFPPTDADSITAAAVPTITAATKDQDSTLTGWTTSIAAGDILRFNVDANDTSERVTISLKVTKA